MALHLTVNGKKYLPSTLLSKQFSYTSDYIGKLAREEKILGVQENRQWFIEPESLALYLHKIEIEKEIQKEALRRERKKEQLQKTVRTPFYNFEKTSAALVKFAETSVVVVCGLFLGLLVHVVHTDGLVSVFVAEGTEHVGTVTSAFSTFSDEEKSDVTSLYSKSGGVVVIERLVSTEPENSTFATLPVVSSLHETQHSSTSADSAKPVAFSDEVRVVSDSNGSLFLVPVSKAEVPVDVPVLPTGVTEPSL